MNSRNPNLPVAILAGGLATRLRPLTETVPKSLLEVAGKPFLHHQLIRLREQGVSEIVLCIGHLGEAIRDRFDDGRQYGVRIRYSWDGPSPAGTAGAIQRALPLLGDAFFVLYGDSYLDIDYRSVARAFFDSGLRGLMTVFRNDGAWDTSNVALVDGRIAEYDKSRRSAAMRHIDYGLSVFRSSVFSGYPPDSVMDLSEVMRDLVRSHDLAAYEATRRFFEIGSPAGLAELDRALRRTNAPSAAAGTNS